MSRKVIITLPPDLERYVEDVDGRKLPSLIVEELRKAWFPSEPMTTEEVIRGTVLMNMAAEYPTISSIPSERKNG